MVILGGNTYDRAQRGNYGSFLHKMSVSDTFAQFKALGGLHDNRVACMRFGTRRVKEIDFALAAEPYVYYFRHIFPRFFFCIYFARRASFTASAPVV